MQIYTIRHIPTGALMPARMFRTTYRGWTYWEPTGAAGLGGEPGIPRFFPTRRAASVALTAWIKGPHTAHQELESESWELPEQYTVSYGTVATPAAIPRIRTEMEIVTFNLIEST